MIVIKQDPMFADADDEDDYQAARLTPIIRDTKTCRLRENEVESSDKVVFEPPLYIQRYAKVVEVCRTHQFKKVADIGTAELTFVQYLKNLDFVNQIFAVDIDRALLDSHKNRCKPLMFDYLNRRLEPLNITVLCGSVLEFDSILYDLDCICAIELIEHLQADDVQKFSKNLFGRLKPKHAIMTTPNKDFNVLFDFVPGQTRHWDHKFEWTREEFADYCESVIDHGYTYDLFGVGDPPADHEFVGPCSQGAIFTRLADSSELSNDSSSGSVQCYEELYSVDYPVADTSITPDHHLTNELVYLSRQIGLDQYQTEGDETSEILISHLQTFPSIEQYCVPDDHIAELARQCDILRISDDGLSILVSNVPDSPEPPGSESDLSENGDGFGEGEWDVGTANVVNEVELW